MLHSNRISKPLIRTDIFLSDFQRETLKSLAAAQDITAAELTLRILDRHLKRALKKRTAAQQK
jgi:hypothetical protein